MTIVGPITTLAGLRRLTSVTALVLQGTRLTTLQGLGPVVFEVDGALVLHQNPSIVTLADFAGQAAALGNLTISENAQLHDLAGLESVRTISGFQLTNNRALTSLHGLESLSEVYSLDIEQNRQLTTVAALGSLTTLWSLTAVGNDRLPTCEIRALFRRTGGQYVHVEGNDSAATCP